MPDAQDMDLVREFARHNSEAAFTELVRRHIPLVYSVARRCTGNDGDAQDVTQAVFIILARKAAGLREHTLLPGWLYETTRFTAARLLRTNVRRQHREQEAYMQSTLNEADTADVWEKLSPHLEDAMSTLAERDRALLVLRFYQNKSGPEAAALLGIREGAAHMRVTRAIEKMRIFFAKRGVDSTAATIAETISANSIQAAPVALAKSVTAVAIAKGAAASTSTLTLIKGALKIMAWTKTKTAVVVGVAGVLVVGITSITVPMFYPVEPRYQGKPLNEWLKQYQSIFETTPPITSKESDRRVVMQTRIAIQNQAEGAIHHIGAGAIPILLKWANTTNAIGRTEPFVPGYDSARIGFSVIGATAKSATPALTGMLSNEDFNIRGCALLDLGAIGTNAADALPAVIELMKNDKVYYIRAWAAAAVGDIGINQPDRIIPILLEALNTTNNPALRANSLASLGKLGEKAKTAVPFIVPYLKDEDSPVSAAAGNALSQIGR